MVTGESDPTASNPAGESELAPSLAPASTEESALPSLPAACPQPIDSNTIAIALNRLAMSPPFPTSRLPVNFFTWTQ